MKAAVIMDMVGCPNRCKHCWLGHETNGNVKMDDYIWVSEQFKDYKLDSTSYFTDLEFSSWYREPDYANNYKELWKLDKKLSTSKPQGFELASIWRLARDDEYAPWLKSLGVDTVQVTLFGGEKNTDYFTGRKGAYQDIIKSLDVLLKNEIIPRIQIFIYQTNVPDLVNIVPLLCSVEDKLNKPLTCYATTSDAMGAGYELENIRMTKNDLEIIPKYIVDKTLVNKGKIDFFNMWKTEAELLPELMKDEKPPNDNPNTLAFMVSSEFNVYPNSGEIADYANLGNLKSDGINVIMDNFLNRNTLSLKLNYEMPVSYLAKKYGNINSMILTSRYELCKKWIHSESIHTV